MISCSFSASHEVGFMSKVQIPLGSALPFIENKVWLFVRQDSDFV